MWPCFVITKVVLLHLLPVVTRYSFDLLSALLLVNACCK
ncbi:hypothetical protein SOVF_041870 [Spinacia oleracea]|nr:hypothetical protein SOVF_041870 [Spinacia oleracea]